MSQRTTSFLFLLAGVLIGFFLSYGVGHSSSTSAPTPTVVHTAPECLGEECLNSGIHFPFAEATTTERIALTQDILYLYQNEAQYRQAVQQFGSQYPFSMLLRSTERDIVDLEGVFDKYGLPVPQRVGSERPLPRLTSVSTTCAQLIDRESPILEWQNQRSEAFSSRLDVQRWLSQRRTKTLEVHLPALQACAQNK